MCYKTGSIGEFMRWTKRVVADPAAAGTEPKRWFDTDATASKLSGGAVSPEAMVKLLSPENLDLLTLAGSRHPQSLHAFATLAWRKSSCLSRTLKKLLQAGSIGFKKPSRPHHRAASAGAACDAGA